ncbi:AraC family transcriptional regulator [Nocardioides sp.]|uniref:AraC family transcriptional regulator n=1 Tax=Nocardioides sp. TaxID=35761 RepID=UPI002733E664|nr:AraC family transcriptional regulator [Nocardioides sp.]MDP3892964.1 AraC family transcriptional regulator [Nocardioides sp.]
MARLAPAHDPEPVVPGREPTGGPTAAAGSPAGLSGELAVALSQVRLRGAVFLRAEYTESWGYVSIGPEDTAALLSPGSPRVALFHVIGSGRCWVALEDGDRYWAGAGDVVVLPYGDLHRVGGIAEADCVPVDTLLDPPPWDRMPVIRYGAGGDRTDVVCGYLDVDDPLFDPRIRALPPLFVVSPPEGPAREWVRASIDYAAQQTSPAAAGGLVGPTQLPELLVREVLRLHLAGAPAVDTGWLAALRDPVLAPAMAAIHRRPEHKWTVQALAQEAHVSPSLLDERFRQRLGLAPIRYLTGWRMHVAEELLTSTDLGVAAVARRVGYEAEEGFSRAFKRSRGVAPRAWRDEHGAAGVRPPSSPRPVLR